MEQIGTIGAAGAVVYSDSPALYTASKALSAKIPTASAHTAYPPGESPTAVWFACDVSLAAEEVAMELGKKMGGKGVAALSQSSPNVLEDKTGEVFIATMAEHFPDIEVLPSFYEGLDATEAIAKASAAFMARPDITGVFGMTGGSPTTWAVALRDAGVPPGSIPIVGMDYTEPNLELVKSGEVFALVGQPLVEEFYAATVAVGDLLAGKSVPEGNLLDAPFITADNVNDYDAYVAAAKEK
jgi:ribose transport system substrate-binding protein